MNKNFPRLGFAIIALVTVANVVTGQSTPKYDDLPNFHVVNNQLYRGGQPRTGGFQRLAQLGIKTVVNLRKDDDRARADAERAQTAGLRYLNVPMARHARPTDEQIQRALSIINTPENQPVFIYCRRGADRTGTVIAAYRISQYDWTSGMAKAEATRYGMFVTQLEMKGYITEFYCRHSHAGPKCGDQPLINEVGVAAAKRTRRLVEGVGAHSITRSGLSRVRRLF